MNRANIAGFRAVTILVGDTLQDIAARELDDASLWALLIEINDLVYPYIAPAAADRVLGYGDSILVPATAAQVSAVADPVDAFGTDLDLAGGDLAVDDFGDFAVISGRANLKQAIASRVETPLRALLFHLDYGCGAANLKGGGNSPTAGILAAQYVKSALRSDDRIAAVLSVTAVVRGASITVEGKAQPVTGAPIPFSATV